MTHLASFASSSYSQNGEDGVLAEVLRRIAVGHDLNKWCVEFGAWDGVLYSNTARLIRKEDYSAVLIEGDAKRARDLMKAHPGHRVIGVHAFVGFDGEQRLDAILRPTPLPKDFDLLSIDVDGCDYHIWEAVQEYRPKVVVIEFNPTIPNVVDYVQARDPRVSNGSSASAMVKLAQAKGYTLAALVAFNLVFVADEYADHVLGADRPTLADLRDDSEAVCYVFLGYDGTVLTSRALHLRWMFNVPLSTRRLQVIPAPFRTYRGGIRRKDVAARYMTAFMASPAETSKAVWHRIRPS